MNEDFKIGDEVLLLSDENGDFTQAIGCELDFSNKPVGLGRRIRSRRYAMYVEDGAVKILNSEEAGDFNADDMFIAIGEFRSFIFLVYALHEFPNQIKLNCFSLYLLSSSGGVF
ncbi:Thioredoxin superfamily protein [Perilla frutescens var. frutescens]|nr:Thioredoxin superfamily protein [Perilla frutescens var. frutescens]